MKKTLSFLMAMIMVLSMFTITAFAAETEKVISGTQLVLGDNTVTVDSTANTTIFEFEPEEAGSYTFTADSGVQLGYWGAGSFFTADYTESKTNTLTQTVSAVGQSIMVGVTGATGSVNINVAMSGEYVDTSIKYTTYVNSHTPSATYQSCYTFDSSASASGTYVLGVDGFYHLGSADGKLVVVNLNSSKMSISAMLGTGAAKYHVYDEDGNITEAYDYTDALSAYAAMGNYPLTYDLMVMLPNIAKEKQWVENGWLTSWQDLCTVAETSHSKAGWPMTEYNDDGSITEIDYCEVCYVELAKRVVMPGEEGNPISLYVPTASVDVAAGATVYCQGAFNGTYNMTVTGTGSFTVTYNGTAYESENGSVTLTGVSSSYWTMADIRFTNNSESAATYSVQFALPVGAQENPVALNMGSNSASIEAGNQEGYWFIWTAPCNGTLYITMPTGNWTYAVNNLTSGQYGDTQWNDSDPVVNPAVVTVNAGDVIKLMVNTYDPENMWSNPAGTLTIEASFEYDHAWEEYEAVEPTCDTEGNIAYKQCTLCGAAETMDGMPLSKYGWILGVAHDWVEYEAVEPTCDTEGNIAYKVCTKCGAAESMDGMPLSMYGWILGPSHDWVEYEAVEPTCETEGNIAYKVCTKCGAAESMDGMPLSKYGWILGVAHEWVEYEAVEPTCETEGNIAYKQCTLCGAAETMDGMPLSKYGWILGVAHEWEEYEAVEPTCDTEGNIAYKVCTKCGAAESMDGMPLSMYGWILGPAHDWVEYEAVEPTCDTEGNIAYKVCTKCGAAESMDGMPLSKYGWILGPSHDWVEYEAVEPTCETEGNIAYKVCTKCGAAESMDGMPLSKYGWILGVAHEWVEYEAVEPTCETEGNIAYKQCTLCGAAETMDGMPLSKYGWILGVAHEWEEYEAVEPTCDTEGNIAYKVCTKCGAAETMDGIPLSKYGWILGPAHDWVEYEAVEPTCDADGNIAYKVCTKCGAAESMDGMPLSKYGWILGATHKTIIHMDAVEPGCHYDGNIEYWYCADCYTCWQDEDMLQITNMKNVIIPAVGGEVVHVEAVEPGCESEGNIEYWYCEECEQVWQDEALTQLTNIKNVVLPATHKNIVHVEAVAPDCVTEGNIEYWYCADCGIHWQDAAMLQITNSKNVILPATHMHVTHVEAVAATCHGMGNIEYWFCEDCGMHWQNEGQTQVTNAMRVILPALGNDNMKHVAAVKPTCTKDGNVEYWYCDQCDSYYLDEAGTQLTNIKRVVDPATGHTYKDGVCTVCGAEEPKDSNDNAQTGDSSMIVLMTVVMILTAGAAAVLVIKKRRMA